VKAVRLLDWKSEPQVVEVDRPEPGRGEVLLKVGGAGACHSDLHLMDEFEGGVLPWGPPFTLGHENAGWVEVLGEGVTGLEVGQPVAVYGPWGCGSCGRCSIGIENYCENPMAAPVPGGGGGLGLDGGMAEYLLVPAARFLVPLPDGLDPVQAAPLTDAGLTPYHAIRRSLPKLTPDATAVVIGVGGLGHMAVQLLRAITGSKIVAVDQRESALRNAREHGADAALMSGSSTADEIRSLTGGRGADVVLDFVGADATLSMGAAAARTMGDLTIVGIAGGSLSYGFLSVPYELSVQSTYWGTRVELVELLDLAARGLVRSKVTTYDLDHAVDAYQALRSGEIDGRAVVVPNAAS
jgi:propanol-preferring alcohol dehydrogenase